MISFITSPVMSISSTHRISSRSATLSSGSGYTCAHIVVLDPCGQVVSGCAVFKRNTLFEIPTNQYAPIMFLILYAVLGMLSLFKVIIFIHYCFWCSSLRPYAFQNVSHGRSLPPSLSTCKIFFGSVLVFSLCFYTVC